MIVRMFACVALIASAVPASAQKNPPPLETPAGKPFLHANSGITLPAQLIDLQRTGAREYAQPQLDVLFTYTDAADREELSVYIYRVTAGVPAIWFGEAIRAIGDRPAFRRMTDVELPVAFVPPGQTMASGMKAAWKISDSSVRSTAIAIVPVGEWLVKFRYSSRTHEAEALVRRLDAMIAKLGWPAKIPAAPPAARISDCAVALKPGARSNPVKDDAATIRLDATTVAGMANDRIRGRPGAPAPVQWCRDSVAAAPDSIYRPVDSDDSYLLALTDSGQAVWVRPPLWEPLGDGRARWAVSVVRAGEMISYENRDRLPPPSELDRIMAGEPVSHLVTWGELRELRPVPAQPE
ncbi:hypothetical protein [Sphingomonas koreensis]